MGLGLALWLRWPLLISRIGAIAVGHGTIVAVMGVHGTLLVSEAGSGARIILWVRPSIVAVDRLPHRRGALHHVGCLRRHCSGPVTLHPHLRLRGHGLRAASHGWIGAKDVCEGGFPCARGLATVGAARKLWPLLVPVVGHVLCPLQSTGSLALLLVHPQARLVWVVEVVLLVLWWWWWW